MSKTQLNNKKSKKSSSHDPIIFHVPSAKPSKASISSSAPIDKFIDEELGSIKLRETPVDKFINKALGSIKHAEAPVDKFIDEALRSIKPAEAPVDKFIDEALRSIKLSEAPVDKAINQALESLKLAKVSVDAQAERKEAFVLSQVAPPEFEAKHVSPPPMYNDVLLEPFSSRLGSSREPPSSAPLIVESPLGPCEVKEVPMGPPEYDLSWEFNPNEPNMKQEEKI
jgi:vacuolar-type H+-ATPase subunit H